MDMKNEERRSLWMTMDEMISIKKQNWDIVTRIDEEGRIEPESDEFTIRGLESQISFNCARQHKQLHRHASIDEVLDEQDRQRFDGYYDDASIALAYKSVTKQCQQRAYQIGSLDHVAAATAA
jgi:hypothetical protein